MHMRLSFVHYPDIQICHSTLFQSTRVDSSFFEGVEVRVADFSLTGSGYGKILPRSGRFRGRGGRSEAR